METINHNNLPEAMGLLLQKIERLENLIQAKQSPEVLEYERLNIDEASKLTGYSKSAIYKGFLPHYRMGKKLIFLRKELIEWMEAQTVPQPEKNYSVLSNVADSANKKSL